MKRYLLFLFLVLPVAGYGQGYQAGENALGTDSLWLNFMGSSIFRHHASGAGVAFVFDQDPAAATQFGVRNQDTAIIGVAGSSYVTLTNGPAYDTPTGDVKINAGFTFGSDGSIAGGVLVHGRDSWTTTAQHDTVTISGAQNTDDYIITLKGTTAPGATDAYTVEPTSTGFIVHRGAAGTSGLNYIWFRVR